MDGIMHFFFKSFVKFVLLIFCSSMLLSCGVNALREFANKQTDEALLEDSRIKMNNGDWTGAIANFSSMSTDFLAREDTKHYYASAYAGRCGYDFLSFVQALGGIGSDTLFFFLMKNYSGATSTSVSDCVQAETILKSIGDESVRSVQDNIFMAMLSLVKVGTILSVNFDVNNDDVVDYAGADEACNVATLGDLPPVAPPGPKVRDELDNDEVGEVGTALALFLTSIAAVGTNIGGLDPAPLTALCTALPPGYDFCSVTDKAAFTADMLKGIRTLINEGTGIGIDTCSGGAPHDIPSCPCL